MYKYGLDSLREAGCNVDGLRFDSKLVIRGLIIDKKRGNLVKVDRFGCAKHTSGLAHHASLVLPGCRQTITDAERCGAKIMRSYVKRAMHGTRMMTWGQLRAT